MVVFDLSFRTDRSLPRKLFMVRIGRAGGSYKRQGLLEAELSIPEMIAIYRTSDMLNLHLEYAMRFGNCWSCENQ